MAEIKKVPAIRFKGFSDEWSNKEFENILEIIDGDRGSNYPNGNDFLELGHTLFLNASNVTSKGFRFNNNLYITEEKSKKLGNGKLLVDDIVLTSRGSLGHVAWYSQDIHRKIPFARINSGMLILRASDNSIPSFIAQYLTAPCGQKRINLISFGSAQPQLTKKDICKFVISLPLETNEQTQIGSYFQHLDKLISLHQTKVNKLTNLKKAMLEKMFPKQGADVPETRFKGFAGAWEVEEIGKLTQVIDPHPSHRAPDSVLQGVPFIGIGDISENGKLDLSSVRIVSEDIYVEHSRRYTLSDGDFAYGRVASIGKIIDLSKNVLSKYTYSPTMALIKPISVNSNYLKAYLSTESFKNLVDNKTTGSTRKSLGVEALRTMPVVLPTDKEQTKIGSYFQNLAKTITLHKTELEKLNNLKKACLEKMFI